MPCPASSYTTLANVWVWVFSDQVDGNEKYSHLLHLGDRPRCVLSHTCVSHTRKKILPILTITLELTQPNWDINSDLWRCVPPLLSLYKDAVALTSLYKSNSLGCNHETQASSEPLIKRLICCQFKNPNNRKMTLVIKSKLSPAGVACVPHTSERAEGRLSQVKSHLASWINKILRKKRGVSLQRSRLPKFLHVLQISNKDFMINCSSETTGAEEMNTI